MTPTLKKKHSSKTETKDPEPTENGETKSDAAEEPKPTEGENGATKPEDGSRVSALEELVKMGGGDDQALRLEQAAEQEKFLEKQLTERPLLHMQEQLDKEEGEEDSTPDETNGESTPEHPHHRHNLLKDDDVELMYLEKHLSQLHKAFYDEYDSALVNAHGGRVAQLKPGHKKKVSIKEDSADLKIVPDIGSVMPQLKSKTLEGCVIVMSGLVPLQADILRSEIGIQAASFGAEIQTKVNRKVTHLVASTSRTRTTKVRQAAKYPNIKIVNQQWLLNSMSKWVKEDETPYLVQIHDQDRVREEGFNSSAPSSIHDSDDSEDGDSDDETDDSLPASQEDNEPEYMEGLLPPDMEEGHSPVDDMQGFDWGGVDDELNDFLGDDDDDSANDSDASQASDASRSSKLSVRSKRGTKRTHGETTDESETDEEGALAKRVRTANSRTTGLKTVKTPNSVGSESSLPTPGVTGDEDDVDQIPTNGDEDEDEEDDDELEKEIEAAFESDFEAEMEAEMEDEGGG